LLGVSATTILPIDNGGEDDDKPASPVSPRLCSITSTPTALYGTRSHSRPSSAALPCSTTPTATTPRPALKRSNASYDSATRTSIRPDPFTASAHAASIALCAKIRAVRAGEVGARKAMLAAAAEAEVQKVESGAGGEGEEVHVDDEDARAIDVCEGWGRRG